MAIRHVVPAFLLTAMAAQAQLVQPDIGMKPGFVAPAPGYVTPAPVQAAPEPAYVAPMQGYTAPAPAYNAPSQRYAAPAPSYAPPAPVSSAPAVQGPSPSDPYAGVTLPNQRGDAAYQGGGVVLEQNGTGGNRRIR